MHSYLLTLSGCEEVENCTHTHTHTHIQVCDPSISRHFYAFVKDILVCTVLEHIAH